MDMEWHIGISQAGPAGEACTTPWCPQRSRTCCSTSQGLSLSIALPSVFTVGTKHMGHPLPEPCWEPGVKGAEFGDYMKHQQFKS